LVLPVCRFVVLEFFDTIYYHRFVAVVQTPAIPQDGIAIGHLLRSNKAWVDPTSPPWLRRRRHFKGKDISRGRHRRRKSLLAVSASLIPAKNDPASSVAVAWLANPNPGQTCMFGSAIKTVASMPYGSDVAVDHRPNASLIKT